MSSNYSFELRPKTLSRKTLSTLFEKLDSTFPFYVANVKAVGVATSITIIRGVFDINAKLHPPTYALNSGGVQSWYRQVIAIVGVRKHCIFAPVFEEIVANIAIVEAYSICYRFPYTNQHKEFKATFIDLMKSYGMEEYLRNSNVLENLVPQNVQTSVHEVFYGLYGLPAP